MSKTNEELLDTSKMDAYNEMIRKIEEQIDPLDYLPPSLREIAKMSMTQLEEEFNLVAAMVSTRSSAQRKLIASRWVYEQAILHELSLEDPQKLPEGDSVE